MLQQLCDFRKLQGFLILPSVCPLFFQILLTLGYADILITPDVLRTVLNSILHTYKQLGKTLVNGVAARSGYRK